MFGLLDYESVHGKFNIGDYIQSLAAKQYLPKVDKIINREALDTYNGESLAVILNGWFMHNPTNWPPSKEISPLFISFHINRPFIKSMTTPNAISYFKEQGAIGCRDYYTAEVLEKHGVNSYYSSCLTTTLGRSYQHQGKREGILLVDVMHNLPKLNTYHKLPPKYILSHMRTGNIFKSFKRPSIEQRILNRIPAELIQEVEYMENSLLDTSFSSESRYTVAEEYLNKFSKARLVITSRIHCALPCIAMGTPVIYLKCGQSSETNIRRFHGILDHMNVIDLDNDIKQRGFNSNIIDIEDINFNNLLENPKSYLNYTPDLMNKAQEFVAKHTVNT